MKYLNKWIQFLIERFNPLSYTPMIFVFLGAHYALYINFINQNNIFNSLDILHLIPLVIATSLFFFKLRLFDEVKDMESDIVHHPERPLPRGILSKSEVIQMAFFLTFFEMTLFSYYGFWAFLSALVVVGYSLVMYKEFFLRKWLRVRLTTYAVLHTFVVVLLSITIFTALIGKSFVEIPRELIKFSFSGWFLFNIFEFGRKTFARSEEKEGIDSYSKILGKLGAVGLVLAMAVSGILFIREATSPLVVNILVLLLFPIVIAGLLYVKIDRLGFAKVYRNLASLHIIFTYGIVTLIVILEV